MSQALKAAYAEYQKKLEKQLLEAKKTKEMLNTLALDMGSPIPFPDVANENISGAISIKPDQYFRKPLATCVSDYLNIRKQAVAWPEILSSIQSGGFEIPKGKKSEDLRMTILKNTANFQLIGDNHFGLKEWYPDKKDKTKADLEGNKEDVGSKEKDNAKEKVD